MRRGCRPLRVDVDDDHVRLLGILLMLLAQTKTFLKSLTATLHRGHAREVPIICCAHGPHTSMCMHGRNMHCLGVALHLLK